MDFVSLPVAEQEKHLLTNIANDAHLDWKDLRWWVVCKAGSPRSIVIVTRGKHPNQVQTISETHNAHLWESWKAVRSDWLAKRANGEKRVRHEHLGVGQL